VNGNCAGAYEDLRRHRTDIEVITGDNLLDLCHQVFHTAKYDDVDRLVRVQTQRTIRLIESAYYEGVVYWLVAFNDDAFTITNLKGVPLDSAAAEKIVNLVADAEAVGKFIDLKEEESARKRALVARKLVLSALLLGNGTAKLDEIESNDGGGPDCIQIAADELANMGLIRRNGDNVSINGRDNQTDSYSLGAQFFKVLLDEAMVVKAIGCSYYDSLINDKLLDELLTIQGNVKMDAHQRQQALDILKLSPTAILSVVQPMEIILNHRIGPVLSDKMNATDVDILIDTRSRFITG
jgi:hypothetical protein